MSKLCFISFTKNPRACIVHPDAQVETNGYKLLNISQDLRALTTMSESRNHETPSQGLQAKMHQLEVWRGWRHLRQMQVTVDWESRLTWISSKISKKACVPNCQLCWVTVTNKFMLKHSSWVHNSKSLWSFLCFSYLFSSIPPFTMVVLLIRVNELLRLTIT